MILHKSCPICKNKTGNNCPVKKALELTIMGQKVLNNNFMTKNNNCNFFTPKLNKV
jgi:hypothetical protein